LPSSAARVGMCGSAAPLCGKALPFRAYPNPITKFGAMLRLAD